MRYYVLKGLFISCLKFRKIISKGYIYHIDWVMDIDFEIPTVDSVLIVNEFLKLFPDDLPDIPS